jgi:hypothetical protein
VLVVEGQLPQRVTSRCAPCQQVASALPSNRDLSVARQYRRNGVRCGPAGLCSMSAGSHSEADAQSGRASLQHRANSGNSDFASLVSRLAKTSLRIVGWHPLISRTVVTGRYCEHKFQIRKNEHALSAQTKIANPFRTVSAYSSRHGEFTEILVIAKSAA